MAVWVSYYIIFKGKENNLKLLNDNLNSLAKLNKSFKQKDVEASWLGGLLQPFMSFENIDSIASKVFLASNNLLEDVLVVDTVNAKELQEEIFDVICKYYDLTYEIYDEK